MSEVPASDDLYLTDVSPRDKPWDAHRSNASVVQALYDSSELQQYADRIRACSKTLGFSVESEDSSSSQFKLQQAFFCRVRLCPVCQWRRSMTWQARFYTALPKVQEAHPKAKWVFLTLTVRNCALTDLRATIQGMNKAWGRLVKRKQWPALGFVRSTEVTRSKTGEAHPHFHALLLVPSSYFSTGYIRQDEWAALWRDCLRADYEPRVHIRAVKAKLGTDPARAIETAVLETLKYSVKESDLIADSAWLHELTRQLHKTRAVAVGGVLSGFLSDSEPDDLVHTDESSSSVTSSPEIWFGYREMIKRYVKVDR